MALGTGGHDTALPAVVFKNQYSVLYNSDLFDSKLLLIQTPEHGPSSAD